MKLERKLLARVAELEAKVKALEARPSSVLHHHYPPALPLDLTPRYIPIQVPETPPWEPWRTVWCGVNDSRGDITLSQS